METREETDLEQCSPTRITGSTTMSASGARIIRSTVKASAATGEMMVAEVFQS